MPGGGIPPNARGSSVEAGGGGYAGNRRSESSEGIALAKPMKVLAIVTDAYGGHGGIAQYNRDLLAGFAAMPDVRSILAIPRMADAAATADIHKVVQLGPSRNQLVYALRAAWAALRLRPDTIFSGHVYHGPLALLLARTLRCRLISQLHGDEVWTPLARRHLRPLAASDLVLCVSNDTRDRYLAQLPGCTNAAVLHNTVGAGYVEGDRIAARQKFEVGNAFVLLTVARIDGRRGYKGHELVIRSLAGLSAPAGRPVLYMIAGEGEDRPRLENLVSGLGLQHQVRFLGRVSEAALPDLYRAADLFVMPSSGEGFGIVFIEAMACGTPAIGLDVGGAGEALCDGELGRAVSVENFAAELQRSVDTAGRARLGLADATRKRFGVERFRKRLAQLVRALSDPDGAPA